MGWGIYCTNNLYFHKPSFNNKYGVTEEIEECDRNIENAKQSLLVMAASEPKNLIEKDCEGRDFSIVESINIAVNRALKELEENIINKYKYSILNENWHFTSGDFISQEKYYKYIKESNIIFEKDSIYPANLYQEDYRNEQKYAILLPSYEFISLNQEQINNNFIEVTKEEYDNRTNEL